MLIELPAFWIILFDFIAWFFFHMTISLLCMRIPDDWFERAHKGFKPFLFENNGEVWNSHFRIRRWKKLLPDGSSVVKSAYNKTNLKGSDLDSLRKFIIETKRAELTHWLLILPSILFFIWNPPWAGFWMVVYAMIANVPFILAQRYNRPRLERLLQIVKKRKIIKKAGQTFH